MTPKPSLVTIKTYEYKVLKYEKNGEALKAPGEARLQPQVNPDM